MYCITYIFIYKKANYTQIDCNIHNIIRDVISMDILVFGIMLSVLDGLNVRFIFKLFVVTFVVTVVHLYSILIALGFLTEFECVIKQLLCGFHLYFPFISACSYTYCTEQGSQKKEQASKNSCDANNIQSIAVTKKKTVLFHSGSYGTKPLSSAKLQM